MFSNMPFQNDPSDGDRSPEAFIRKTQEQVATFLRSRESLDISSLSFEEQVRHFLVKNRSEELLQRFATPHFKERMRVLMEGAFKNLSDEKVDESVEDALPDFTESLGIQFREEHSVGEVSDELKFFAESFSTIPELLEFRAIKAAEQEFLPPVISKKMTYNLRLLLAAPPEIVLGMTPKDREMAENTLRFLDFQSKVFEATVDAARKVGVLTATEPKRVRENIRSIISKEDFIEFRLKGISGLSDSIDTIAKVIASSAPDSGEALKGIHSALKGGGQLERIEIEAVCNLMADTHLIWGE